MHGVCDYVFNWIESKFLLYHNSRDICLLETFFTDLKFLEIKIIVQEFLVEACVAVPHRRLYSLIIFFSLFSRKLFGSLYLSKVCKNTLF